MLLQLPPEILCMVVRKLDTRSMLSMMFTCNALYNIGISTINITEWRRVSSSRLPLWFILRNADNLDWTNVCCYNYNSLPTSLLLQHIGKINVHKVIRWGDILPLRLIDHNPNGCNWYEISTYRLPEWFIHKYIKYLPADMLLRYQHLSQSFIERHNAVFRHHINAKQRYNRKILQRRYNDRR